MITREFLETRTAVNKEIRQPSDWQMSGYYPQRYTVTFDDENQVYTVLLTALYKKD